jgi:hypothetical protein
MQLTNVKGATTQNKHLMVGEEFKKNKLGSVRKT